MANSPIDSGSKGSRQDLGGMPAERAYGGHPKGGPEIPPVEAGEALTGHGGAGQLAPNPGREAQYANMARAADPAPGYPLPSMPADVVAALIPLLQRVELTGDEAYAYVRAMTYLRNQQELLKRALA